MLEILIITFFCSIILSLILILILIKVFLKFKILDNPKKYGYSRDPIPHSMGIVFIILFFILSFFLMEHNIKLYLLWGFGFLITIVSFIDDFFYLSPKLRLIIQIFIAGIIGITSIKIGYISGLFGDIINLDSFYLEILNYKVYVYSFIFTIFWYVFIFNSLNWTDGIVGNTAGLSIIYFFIILLLSIKLYLNDNYYGGVENAKFTMIICTILIGIIIPFWYFNIKSKFLMGDSGTMFLGFMLASLAIIVGGKIATVLIVFGIYTVDSIYVIFNRIKNKKNPLLGDKTHLHHRLLEIGLSKSQVLSIIYFFSFVFGITSLFLEKIGKIFIFIIIIFFVILIPKILKKYVKNTNLN